MSKARDLADFISTGSILSDGTIESTEISGVTADATEINKLDGLTADTAELNKLDGVTATTTELNKLAGTTATTSDFDKLSNVTASATELNYMSGATSSVQDQLDNISVTSGSLTKSFTNGETASITLSSALSTAPVVGVTKEVAQTGISSKGAWDVNATASNYELHNTAYDTTLAKSSVAVANISDFTDASKNFQTSTFGASPNPFFKTDGTKMYICSRANAFVYQYSLSTAWDVSTASYDNKSFSTNAQTSEGDPTDLFFKPDGTLLFVVGQGNDQVYAYSLTTAWDISTASPTASNFMSTASQETAPRGIFFKSDGTVIYVVGGNGNATFYYTMSTAWDLSTASYTGSINTATEDNGPNGINFNSSGTKMYLLGGSSGNGKIFQYNLTTAWDLTTASYSSNFLDITGYTSGGVAKGIALVDNDTRLYFGAGTSNPAYVHQLDGFSNALALGTGSFASTDVGKRIQGNGGDVILTSTAGAYDITGGSDFTDTSTIASGSWTMHGLKSAGATDGLTITSITGAGYDVANASYTNNYYDTPDSNSLQGIFVNEAGTRLYKNDNSANDLWEYSLSTAHDITTASQTGNRIAYSGVGPGESDMRGMSFKPDGTRLYLSGSDHHRIYMYNITTAFDLTVNAYAGSAYVNTSHQFPGGIALKPDGTKLFHTSGASNQVAQYTLGNPWDFSNNVTFNGAYNAGAQLSSPSDVKFNDDGTKMYVLDATSKRLGIYSLSTAYTITSGVTHDGNLDLSTHATNLFGLSFSDSGANMYIGGSNGNVYQYATQEVTAPTSSYHIAATNSGGQISTEYWTDINSMTADQSLGDGEAYYAVSTDDRTTWSVAKASDGVRPIVRNNAGTWQYNSDAGSTTTYDISSPTHVQDFDISGYSTDPYGLTFKPDGTVVYIASDSGNRVIQQNLTTAWDLSTMTAASHGGILSTNSQETAPSGVQLSSDGTKAYVIGTASDTIYQYTLTNAWDVYPSSYANKSFSVSSVGETLPNDIFFKPDGTKLFMVGKTTDKVHEITLTTAWDIDTASFSGNDFSVASYETGPQGLSFSSDGTKMFTVGINYVTEWALSTAWDITTASYVRAYDSSAQETDPHAIAFKSDGTKMYIMGSVQDNISEYNVSNTSYTTSTTWTNATTNDEFYALQQALGATEFNRMDKTQLDAVADGSHFTLGDTLDLAIALKQDTASASLPTSDGVSINYDAEALNQGAVLGTDYDYDFPDSTTVRITSNAAQNLKIRVV